MKTAASETHDVRLDITVWEELWHGLYDRIEVHRSTMGEAGPYNELTGPAWSGAFVPADWTPGNSSGPYVNIVGRTLSIRVNLRPLSVTFTGSDPLTFAQAALQASNAFAPLAGAFVDGHGRFVLGSTVVGGQVCLEVLSSDAAALLGLPLNPVDATGYGRDPRLQLIVGVEQYTFRDYYGQKDYFYRVRFRNSLTGAVSAFSGPISAVPYAGLSSDKLVTGYVKLVRGDGAPDVKQEITIFLPTTTQRIEGATVNGGQRVFLTDDTGRIEARLIRGTQVDVGIGGMNLMRRVTVPTDPSIESFDLLDPQYGEDDTFAVQRLNIPYAEKMNL